MKYYGNELFHHGILGQKWGVRRFQNRDGSYTSEGKRRYLDSKESYKIAKRKYRSARSSYLSKLDQYNNNSIWVSKNDLNKANKIYSDSKDSYESARNTYLDNKSKYKSTPEYKKEALMRTGMLLAGTALAAYGAYSVSKYLKDQHNIAVLGKDIAMNLGFSDSYKAGAERLISGKDKLSFYNGDDRNATQRAIIDYAKEAVSKKKAAEALKVNRSVLESKHLYNIASKMSPDQYLQLEINAKKMATDTIKKAGDLTLDLLKTYLGG